MTRRTALAAALALAGVVAAGGCGYSLVGRTNNLPSSVRSVSVPVFRNLTDRAGVEQWLSEAVARELAGRGGLAVAARESDADAVLDGEVTSYTAWPSNLDASGRATEYQIVVTCSVRLVSSKGEKLLSIPGFQFQEIWPVTDPSGVPPSDFSDRQNIAVERLASKFAESLVTALLDGF